MGKIVSTPTEERINPKLSLTAEAAERLLVHFGLTPAAPPVELSGGRLASNWIVRTTTVGDVILRLYPLAYGASKVTFETEALAHLAAADVPVPSPVLRRNGAGPNEFVAKFEGGFAFVYQSLAGSALTQAKLTSEIAEHAGAMLSRMITPATGFRPKGPSMYGDLPFIAGLLRAAKERSIELALHPVAGAMEAAVADGDLKAALERTPLGLVHGDYFFENLLIRYGQISAVLDLGDAFYGYVLHDLAIGAMEFAVLEDETWRIDFWQSFVRENNGWLRDNLISGRLLRQLTACNCVRFAVYTLPFTNQEGGTILSNRYVKRFIELEDGPLGNEIERCYDEVLKER